MGGVTEHSWGEYLAAVIQLKILRVQIICRLLSVRQFFGCVCVWAHMNCAFLCLWVFVCTHVFQIVSAEDFGIISCINVHGNATLWRSGVMHACVLTPPTPLGMPACISAVLWRSRTMSWSPWKSSIALWSCLISTLAAWVTRCLPILLLTLSLLSRPLILSFRTRSQSVSCPLPSTFNPNKISFTSLSPN